jgi:hypothetical protein
VLGFATADTSAAARLLHTELDTALDCQLGFAIDVLHELPASDHAVSVHPRLAELDFFSDVPPTAVTCADVLGYDGPSPPSS